MAKALQAEGRKVVAYCCALSPLEMLTAVDLIPYRIFGDMSEPVTEVDRALPASFCPIMRSCLDCSLKGRHDFVDGMAMVHSSDPQEKTARIWESYSTAPYFHFLDMPITA
ncbi:MAG: 2-hydroxyacyl-CoA dehydratase family protein, partial [Pseudomonadota bacterium]